MAHDHDPSGQRVEQHEEGSLHDPPADAFGRLLRFWRKVFSESQESLALALDSSPRHISRLENGRVRPSRGMVVRIARHFGLGDDETKHLLYAGGFAVGLDARDFGDPEAAWLRKASARTLEAFEPDPAIIFDESGRVRMLNHGALAILKGAPETATELSVSHAFDFLFEAVKAGSEPRRWLEFKCATVMLLQHEAVLWDDATMQRVVERLVERHRLPPDWQRVAVGVDPMSSITLPMVIGDRTVRVTVFALSIGTRQPTLYPVRPRLTLLAYLVEKDPETLAKLEEHRGLDHPLLYTQFG